MRRQRSTIWRYRQIADDYFINETFPVLLLGLGFNVKVAGTLLAMAYQRLPVWIPA